MTELEAELRPITDTAAIRAVYDGHMLRDFGAEELRPWASLTRCLRRGLYDCRGLYRGETLLGYAFLVRLPRPEGDRLLLDYLAVLPEYRNRGLGSRILGALDRQYADAAYLLCEAEDPEAAASEEDRALRQRRLGFYQRNGYRLTALRSRVFGVAFRLLVRSDRDWGEDALRADYAALYRQMLPPALYRDHVEIL